MAIDFQQGFSDAWSSVATFVPKLIGFLVILVVGWIIAKVVEKIVDKVLERVGFDRLVERGGIQRMLERSKYDASDLLGRLAFYAILLIALQMGFGVFGPNPVSNLINGIVAWLPRAAVAILIVVVAGAIAHAVSDLVRNALGGLSYGPMIGRIAAVFIWGIGIVAALNQIGVATTVTTPVLIAVLATLGGILVVGVGGGLVRPMQQRWEGWLNGLEQEMPAMRGHAEAYQRGREDASRERERMGAQQTGRGSAAAGRDPEQWDEPQPAHGGGVRREPDEPGGYGQQMSGGQYRQYGNPYRGGQAPYGGSGQGLQGGGGQPPYGGGYDEGGQSPYGGGEPRHLR
ncbi:mechanosensitive ion channel family protein [Nocardia testacea]|uniref:mechanosensitive ion channel family protein n=1 Tax=Nocardia testacea TaxID=248551 RepID=UPI003C2C0B2F